MIFLLNNERIRMECLELARLRIAEGLGLPPRDVKIQVDIKDGKVFHAWQLERLPEGMDADTAGYKAKLVAKSVIDGYLYPRLREAKLTAREMREACRA